jgi:hypothetical protein
VHHIQAKLDSETFKELKKEVVDKETTVGDFVKDAVVSKLEESKKEKEDKKMSESESNNQTKTD